MKRKKCTYIPPCIKFIKVDIGSGICQASRTITFGSQSNQAVEQEDAQNGIGWSKGAGLWDSNEGEDEE